MLSAQPFALFFSETVVLFAGSVALKSRHAGIRSAPNSTERSS